MTTGKTIALTRQTFVGKVMSLLFNMLCRLVVAFLPRSKCLLISWLQSPPAVILEPKKIKSLTVSTVVSSICHEVTGLDAMILVFWMLRFKPTFSLSSLTFIERLFSSSSLSAIRVVSSIIDISPSNLDPNSILLYKLEKGSVGREGYSRPAYSFYLSLSSPSFPLKPLPGCWCLNAHVHTCAHEQ